MPLLQRQLADILTARYPDWLISCLADIEWHTSSSLSSSRLADPLVCEVLLWSLGRPGAGWWGESSSWGGGGGGHDGEASVENSSNGLIFRKKRAKNGHFFSKKTGEKRAKLEIFYKEKRATSLHWWALSWDCYGLWVIGVCAGPQGQAALSDCQCSIVPVFIHVGWSECI